MAGAKQRKMELVLKCTVRSLGKATPVENVNPAYVNPCRAATLTLPPPDATYGLLWPKTSVVGAGGTGGRENPEWIGGCRLCPGLLTPRNATANRCVAKSADLLNNLRHDGPFLIISLRFFTMQNKFGEAAFHYNAGPNIYLQRFPLLMLMFSSSVQLYCNKLMIRGCE